jgi:hypothetical protein
MDYQQRTSFIKDKKGNLLCRILQHFKQVEGLLISAIEGT